MQKDRHERVVVGSALWAAAGDAVGWISELTDEKGLRQRAGVTTITEPVEWRRRIGGRFGATVKLQAGTYSDDTQLRLSVCRATRRDGEFDVEAFAKIELPSWQSYALGAGRGTMAAAANLSKNSVTWFSNFFEGKGRGYFDGGGNGAAMRIQPHVWKSNPERPDLFLADVIRDAIVTHGHPQGFCGAAFHALCLAHVLATGEIPRPADWSGLLRQVKLVPEVVKADTKLSMFWLGAWEDGARQQLDSAVSRQVDESMTAIRRIISVIRQGRPEEYQAVLSEIGGFQEDRRGAGMDSAMAALALAWLHRELPNEEALLLSANALSSDTDTIATMAGALLGAARPVPLTWTLQDREYIEREARRMARIAAGQSGDTFHYPDIMNWQPPATQSDAVCLGKHGLELLGLGTAAPFGEVWESGDSEWQWLRLDFGQTVLAKRRKALKPPEHLPYRSAMAEKEPDRQRQPVQAQLFTSLPAVAERPQSNVDSLPDDLDALTDWVIRREFDPVCLGRALLKAIEREEPLERAVAFAAIVTKAILARRKRQIPK